MDTASKNKLDSYDLKKVYEEDIEPHLDEIKRVCSKEKIPFFSCAAVANTEKGTSYKYDGVLTSSIGVTLTDDQFEKHLCVANGFLVRPKEVDPFQDTMDVLTKFDDTEAEPVPEDS